MDKPTAVVKLESFLNGLTVEKQRSIARWVKQEQEKQQVQVLATTTRAMFQLLGEQPNLQTVLEIATQQFSSRLLKNRS